MKSWTGYMFFSMLETNGFKIPKIVVCFSYVNNPTLWGGREEYYFLSFLLKPSNQNEN